MKISISRNKREGHYVGFADGKHTRMVIKPFSRPKKTVQSFYARIKQSVKRKPSVQILLYTHNLPERESNNA